MGRIRVVVTAADIAEGRRAVADHCPLALALRRRGFPAYVHISTWTPKGLGGDRCLTSGPAAHFALAFDAGQPVQPATFYLEGPDR